MKEALFQSLREQLAEQKLGKKLAAGAAAAVAAAAVASALAVSSGSAANDAGGIPGAPAPAGYTAAETLQSGAETEMADEADARARARRRKAARAFLGTLKGVCAFAVSAAFQLFSFFARGLLSLLGGGVLAGLLGFLAEALAIFVLLLAVFLLLFKALFPNRPLREYFTRRNLLALLGASLALALIRRIVLSGNETLAVTAALLRAFLSLGCIGGALYFVFSREGVGADACKRALASRPGRAALYGLVGFTAAAALLRLLAPKAGMAGALFECALLFALAAAAALCVRFWAKRAQTYPKKNARPPFLINA